MRTLGDTIGRLAAHRASAAQADFAQPGADRLSDLANFGSNPGALKARCFVPVDLPDDSPLVVVLHGCTQTAAGYDAGSGWSVLAEAQGFALLFPEQVRGNNANLCFNWFVPGDIVHGAGEVLSIRQMIDTMVKLHGLDRRRIFVTGLSAGGAMAMAMLATAPEVFAGGAIIAGLPYGTAKTMPEAFDRMRGMGLPDAEATAKLVRAASAHVGETPWPVLSVWQGSADKTVDAANAQAIIGGWAALHGVSVTATEQQEVNGHVRRVWRDTAGKPVIEAFAIGGMAHGTPIGEGAGAPAPFMLDAGISSTLRIAAFWGIAPAVAEGTAAAAGPEPVAPNAEFAGFAGPGAMIEQALRSAGLMR
ncbi:polyhydroxybutyrate depolymerase [Polymorphobacter glacialis]|uniref:Polyhydroxybutyrate depolymerase n=1 Tax=Sandarakinorhabdus glacialis TaxID=1614636 RepID=A0A917EBQ7_9SPHN|nr:PHB depolymerase family esterase [Polymorphobacter glacialis]GGE19251.1 polyhydroxybutyrate depolymerase [Polymorphobacter glacialis]